MQFIVRKIDGLLDSWSKCSPINCISVNEAMYILSCGSVLAMVLFFDGTALTAPNRELPEIDRI